MRELNEQGRVPIKLWTDGVELQFEALNQLRAVAELPIVRPHVAVMPDVHYGIGATVGSVIPTVNAIIPAAVGVDIGCGMMALNTGLDANAMPSPSTKIRKLQPKNFSHLLSGGMRLLHTRRK